MSETQTAETSGSDRVLGLRPTDVPMRVRRQLRRLERRAEAAERSLRPDDPHAPQIRQGVERVRAVVADVRDAFSDAASPDHQERWHSAVGGVTPLRGSIRHFEANGRATADLLDDAMRTAQDVNNQMRENRAYVGTYRRERDSNAARETAGDTPTAAETLARDVRDLTVKAWETRGQALRTVGERLFQRVGRQIHTNERAEAGQGTTRPSRTPNTRESQIIGAVTLGRVADRPEALTNAQVAREAVEAGLHAGQMFAARQWAERRAHMEQLARTTARVAQRAVTEVQDRAARGVDASAATIRDLTARTREAARQAGEQAGEAIAHAAVAATHAAETVRERAADALVDAVQGAGVVKPTAAAKTPTTTPVARRPVQGQQRVLPASATAGAATDAEADRARRIAYSALGITPGTPLVRDRQPGGETPTTAAVEQAGPAAGSRQQAPATAQSARDEGSGAADAQSASSPAVASKGPDAVPASQARTNGTAGNNRPAPPVAAPGGGAPARRQAGSDQRNGEETRPQTPTAESRTGNAANEAAPPARPSPPTEPQRPVTTAVRPSPTSSDNAPATAGKRPAPQTGGKPPAEQQAEKKDGATAKGNSDGDTARPARARVTSARRTAAALAVRDERRAEQADADLQDRKAKTEAAANQEKANQERERAAAEREATKAAEREKPADRDSQSATVRAGDRVPGGGRYVTTQPGEPPPGEKAGKGSGALRPDQADQAGRALSR